MCACVRTCVCARAYAGACLCQYQYVNRRHHFVQLSRSTLFNIADCVPFLTVSISLSTDSETLRTVLVIVCLVLTIVFSALVVVVAINVKREYENATYMYKMQLIPIIQCVLLMLMHLRILGYYTGFSLSHIVSEWSTSISVA